ncbi:ATP-binding protein [Nonomuraea sp. PA05]|uniref:ATP-binding protein n=1 Tax=Nonomuraea sp. PA05 TaxID=2604466 RepID=UPI001651F0B4|nr:ATP-binding protein [Nonomuraea sp. PA05]
MLRADTFDHDSLRVSKIAHNHGEVGDFMSVPAFFASMPDVARWQGTTLRRSKETPCQARRMLRRWLGDVDPDLRYNAVLVACELVTNVIRHVPAGDQRNWVEVRLGTADDFIRLKVIDPGTPHREPRFEPLNPGSMRQSGRGLSLVASLAIRCGTHLTDGEHRVVWADLPWS